MLVPLTRKTFEELVPLVATADQYKYCWGKLSDLLRRLLISIAGVVVVVILRSFLGQIFDIPSFLLGFSTGFYWLWGPVYLAGQRNRALRRYPYSGFWQGEVQDAFVTEELVNTEETVNQRGELVLVENRERCLNLEIGDRTGFYTQLQVPLKRDHRAIRPGDMVEMLVVSNRTDLSRIAQTSDIYLPDYNLWVSDYPFLRRDSFVEVSRRLQLDDQQRAPINPERQRSPKRRQRRFT
jgi:hypothetical protein